MYGSFLFFFFFFSFCTISFLWGLALQKNENY